MDNTFFNKIIAKGTNPIVETLRARGFLIHENHGRFFLSDNAAAGDAEYLQQLLEKYNLGTYVPGKYASDDHPEQNALGTIIINPSARTEDAICVFTDMPHICGESCFQRVKWEYFLNRRCAPKCDVSLLEPFVARYIKAISACGMETDFSCDGNHEGGGKIIIGCRGHFAILHDWIYKNVVPEQFRSRQYHNGTIPFTPGSQMEECYKLNMAAAYLYEHRIPLRELKSAAAKKCVEKYGWHKVCTPQEYQEILSELFNNKERCILQ